MLILKSFPPIIDKHSRILILGSMPGMESLKQNRYYAHNRNHFWKIIYAVFGLEPDHSYKEREKFILSKKIALWDVIRSCTREGSLDSKIKDEKPNDIAGLICKYPEIRFIIFNGSKAHNSFRKYIKPDAPPGITYIKMPSTSPAHAVSFDKKLAQWMILKEIPELT